MFNDVLNNLRPCRIAYIPKLNQKRKMFDLGREGCKSIVLLDETTDVFKMPVNLIRSGGFWLKGLKLKQQRSYMSKQGLTAAKIEFDDAHYQNNTFTTKTGKPYSLNVKHLVHFTHNEGDWVFFAGDDEFTHFAHWLRGIETLTIARPNYLVLEHIRTKIEMLFVLHKWGTGHWDYEMTLLAIECGVDEGGHTLIKCVNEYIYEDDIKHFFKKLNGRSPNYIDIVKRECILQQEPVDRTPNILSCSPPSAV